MTNDEFQGKRFIFLLDTKRFGVFPLCYGNRWYRMQNMEAGIIAQRLYLAAAALKLGCRASLDLSNAKDKQYMSLMRITIAPECPGYQQYEQSLLI